MFDALTGWHWLILSVLLFSAEALGAAGFLLGGAVAALVVSGAVAMAWLPGWQSQLLTFALMAVLLTLAYFRLFKRTNEKTDRTDLNDRAGQLVGRRIKLTAELQAGQGRTQIGDTFWRVKVVEDSDSLREGDSAEIVGAEQQILLIKAVK